MWTLEVRVAITGPQEYEWEVVTIGKFIPLWKSVLKALDFCLRKQFEEYLFSYRLRNTLSNDTIDLKGLLGLEIQYQVKRLYVQDSFSIGSLRDPGRRGSRSRP